jgi:hypothetical protein
MVNPYDLSRGDFWQCFVIGLSCPSLEAVLNISNNNYAGLTREKLYDSQRAKLCYSGVVMIHRSNIILFPVLSLSRIET